jgi:hypothetical protein
MMFTDKLFLTMLVLMHHLNLTIAKLYPEPVAEVQCYPPLPKQSAPQIADCQAAINAIPDGILEFGSASRSLDLMELPLPPSARKHTYHQKPVFRSGSCYISLDPGTTDTSKTMLPKGLAKSALYFKIFPAVREGAKKILRECLMKAGKLGIVLVQADLYGQQKSYEITLGSMDNAKALPETSGPFWGGAFYMHAVDRDGKVI